MIPIQLDKPVKRPPAELITGAQWIGGDDDLELELSYIDAAGMLDHNPANKSEYPPLKMVDDERVRFLGQRDEYERLEIGERQRFENALASMPDKFRTLVVVAMNSACGVASCLR